MNRQRLSTQNIIAHLGFGIFLAVMFFASFAITGCSDSGPLAPETTTGTGTPSATVAQEGTILVLATYQTDSLGHTSHMANDTAIVGRLHASKGGRENVREITSGTSTRYFHHASNGDLLSLESDGSWSRLPFSGENIPAPERSEEVRGGEKRVLIIEQKHIGEKSMSVGGEIYRAVGIEVLMTQETYNRSNAKDAPMRLADRRKVTTEIWFVPALDFFGEISATGRVLDSQGNVLSVVGKVGTRLTTIKAK